MVRELEMDLQKIERIQDMLIPKIIGLGFQKQILALQLFARPELGELLHLGLVGKVATAKSEIALEISEICPNSGFVGKRTTGIGLSEKLVMCDKGIVAVDEADKIGKHVLSFLLEAAQSGKVHYDKYRRHIQINARMNLLLCCNPLDNQLNENIPLQLQVNFDKPLLSRLHFLLAAPEVEPSLYPEIAMGYTRFNDEQKRKKYLFHYISTIKSKIGAIEVPEKISRELGKVIGDMKEYGTTSEFISPRLIQGCLSMCKAKARMNWREVVTKDDLEFVKGILDRLYG